MKGKFGEKPEYATTIERVLEYFNTHKRLIPQDINWLIRENQRMAAELKEQK